VQQLSALQRKARLGQWRVDVKHRQPTRAGNLFNPWGQFKARHGL